MTRSSWLPSAMPSSSTGWRRITACTSLIFTVLPYRWMAAARAPPRARIVDYSQIVYNPDPHGGHESGALLARPGRAGEAVRAARASPLEQPERVVAPVHPGRHDPRRRRADGAGLRRRARRRARGAGRGSQPGARDATGGRARPSDRRPVRVDRGLTRLHAAVALRRQPQPLLPRLARRA